MFAWVVTLDTPTEGLAVNGAPDGYLFSEVGRARTTLVSLWPTLSGALDAAARTTRVGTVVRDACYEVEDDLHASGPTGNPRAGILMDFDGPRSEALLAAARRAYADRLVPTLLQTPGFVRSLGLWHRESCSHLIINVAVSMEALADLGRAVAATELLPGEDPALLPGPDRVAVNEITDTVRSAS